LMNRIKDTTKTASVAVIVMLTIAFFLTAVTPTNAQSDKAQLLVDKAVATLEDFLKDPNMIWFRDNLKYTKGLLIMPTMVKAGFFWGGSGGNGVMFSRDPKTNQWSGPAFYSMGSVSFGLQIGGQVSAVAMMILTQKGMESLYSSNVKIGGTTSAAAGPVGVGAAGSTALNMSADMLTFIRAKGAFVGAALDGALLVVNDGYNESYYGRTVRPVDIFVTRNVNNPGSSELRAQLQEASIK
jgi:lipid-binding SYLF domain-containing protein